MGHPLRVQTNVTRLARGTRACTAAVCTLYTNIRSKTTPATLFCQKTIFTAADVLLTVQLKAVFRLCLSLVELVLCPLVLQLKIAFFCLHISTQRHVIVVVVTTKFYGSAPSTE